MYRTETEAVVTSTAPDGELSSSETAPAQPARKFSRTKSIVTSPAAKAVLGILLVLSVWEAAVVAFRMPNYLLVGPIAAILELVEQPGYYLEHSWITLQESLVGFVLGAALGILCGAVLFYIPLLRHLLYPSLIAINTIPKVALAPLFIVWFGFGFESKAVVAMAIAFFPLVINTFDGLASVPPELRELAKINRASRFMQMTKIEIIYSLPYLFTGMKISISMAVGGAVVGEFIAGSSGLGHIVLLANSQVNLASMFAAFIVLAAMSLLLFMAIEVAGKKLLPWSAMNR
ncbi:MAG TPA: ABC transporter permease [Microbacteriaceae bacterium]|jgi:ABC-type nitrate/sulfonate/bicarbonate transport system, permease component